MMQTTSTPSRGRRPIEVGRILEESFAIYAEHAAPLLFSAFAIFVVVGAAQALLATSGFLLQFLSSVLSLVALTLYTGFVVKLVEEARAGRRDLPIGALFSAASAFLGPLIVNGILRAFAIAIGLILFIVPGLYLLTIWAVCSPAIVAEDRDAFAAFSRSNDLVEGQRMAVFLTILSAFLITLAVTAVAFGIGAALGTGGLVALLIFAETVTAPIGALVATVIFFDLGGAEPASPGDSQVLVEY